jgi:hypothetical protein
MNEMKKIRRRIWLGLVLMISIFAILAIFGRFFFRFFWGN